MDDEEARTRLLDAAEALFYAEGVQAVGMDRIRAESGVPLKRLYRVFPAKEALLTAYLERRDRRWTANLRAAVAAAPEPVTAVFDWLAEWFAEPGFRGCAFLNAHGELGAGPAGVTEVVRRHKRELRALLGELTGPPSSASASSELADRLMILVEGATAIAALHPGPAPALRAREMAELLLLTRDGAGA
ncbi:TetR/AcrR family transcriptional regulator [Streptomyces sp. G-G2]|uniref:TetR/AcrR family transcriptional regulator n=1 Tax=Streptomyces sp. G-G2 TaxID=3046201 RepID=UPI0024BA2695|nr:TetR/AcrR family transcriptional regulator [Streptomyces sp. G-G2]MDJ0384149.1 TetR/AcrR family transcriptional regulator [Streptomyces sp. G-G2]